MNKDNHINAAFGLFQEEIADKLTSLLNLLTNLKMKIKTLILLSVFLFLLSCHTIHRKLLTGRYYLISSADVNGLTLSYKLSDNESYVDLVSESVIAYEVTKNYIVVKQHPHNSLVELEKKDGKISVKHDANGVDEEKTGVINFYIISIKTGYNNFPEKSVAGPLSIKEFNDKKEQMKIGNSFISVD